MKNPKRILFYKISTAVCAVSAEVLVLQKTPFSIELFMIMAAILGSFALAIEALDQTMLLKNQLDNLKLTNQEQP